MVYMQYKVTKNKPKVQLNIFSLIAFYYSCNNPIRVNLLHGHVSFLPHQNKCPQVILPVQHGEDHVLQRIILAKGDERDPKARRTSFSIQLSCEVS